MSEVDKRFQRKHIDKVIYDPTDSNFIKSFKKFVIVPILDFLPIYSLFVWVNLNILLKFDYTLFIFGFAVLLIASFYWIHVVLFKNYLIKINNYRIKLKNLNKPFKFIYLSDIHIGKTYYGTNLIRLRKIINKINSLNLDLVVIGGDFICEKIDVELLLELKNIKAKNKIAVYGNHDADYLREERVNGHPQQLLEIIERSGFRVLINQGELIKINDQEVFFGGIPDLYSRQFDINLAFEKAPKDTPRVLLSHNPDIIDFVKDSDDIDLILSGHNHSGMIFLKPFGALLPMPSKYKWLTRGFFKVGKRSQLFLSQGIGNSTTRLRIGTDSEICIIELQN